MKTTTRRSGSGQRGIMLIECLVYLALWALVLGVAFAAFYAYLDYSKRLGRTTDDIARTLKAGETWRRDVRSATGPLRLVAEGNGQALHIPQLAGELAYLFRDGSVLRQSQPGAQPVEVLPGVKTSAMSIESRSHTGVWHWEVELKPRQKVPQARPLFSFEAVPPTRL